MGAANSRCRRQCLLIQRFPLLDLPVGVVTVNAIRFLNLADELITLAVDLRQRIVGKLAPLLLDLAAHLFPVAFYTVPIHGALLGWLRTLPARTGLTAFKAVRTEV